MIRCLSLKYHLCCEIVLEISIFKIIIQTFSFPSFAALGVRLVHTQLLSHVQLFATL